MKKYWTGNDTALVYAVIDALAKAYADLPSSYEDANSEDQHKAYLWDLLENFTLTNPKGDITVFEQYTAIQRELKALQAKAEEIKPEVMAAMTDKTHTLDDGSKFTISYRKKWTYTADVVQAEEMLKGMKKAEEKTGTATYEETPVLSVKLS